MISEKDSAVSMMTLISAPSIFYPVAMMFSISVSVADEKARRATKEGVAR